MGKADATLTNIIGGNKTSTITWDRNVISASIGDEHLLYMHDELGSPSRILDEMSDTVEMHNFDEFGNDLTVENGLLSVNELHQTGGSIQPFTYTGYQRDDIAATYYAQAREYLPSIGRFTGEDIIKGNGAYPVTLNPYTYCWNRPMDLVDLNGMMPDMNYNDIQNMMVAAEEVKVFGVEKTHYSAEYPHMENSIYSNVDGEIIILKRNENEELTGFEIATSTINGNKTGVEFGFGQS